MNWTLRRSLALISGLLGFLLGAYLAFLYCAWPAQAWYEGDAKLQLAAARSVTNWVDGKTSKESFSTGNAKFDGEWVFGTFMMSAAGLAQVSAEHPEHAAELKPALDQAVTAMLSPAGRAFDKRSWNGEDPLDSLSSDHGHVAYLGYMGFVLGLVRQLYPNHQTAELHDRIIAALQRRYEHAKTLLLETYPGEVYPVDNSSAISAIALHSRATGKDPSPLIRRWVERCHKRFVDPKSGLLFQAWSNSRDAPLDAPRGSGTALAAFFLSRANLELSRQLHEAMNRHLEYPIFGFGLLQEYGPGYSGYGDIDSGPIILGYSISATGFALSSCRIHQDPACFRRRYATFHLFGAPLKHGNKHSFVSGGPLADAIMLAMLTAPNVPKRANKGDSL